MDHDYIGLWLSADHSVRKILLPNGRFMALVGSEIRHQGEYRIEGSRIAYHKDGGLVGEGEFVDGVLLGGAMALYAEGYEEMAAA